MEPDEFGKSTIRNIYYDTPNKLLIRRSIAKPEYKEKLRVRSYKQVKENSKVFIEVKKKYKGIVYKRRMALEEKTAKSYLSGNLSLLDESQISKEIDYLMTYYKNLEPAIFLAYDREAYFNREDSSFRMTFDENLIIRDYDMSLSSPVYGEADMLKGKIVLEVKTVLGMPQWLLDFSSENKIYKASFSKYGNAYMKFLLPKHLKENTKEKWNYNYLKEKQENIKNKELGFKKLKKFMSFLAGVLLYFIFFANWQLERIPESRIYVDVNPSVNFTANSKRKVIDLEAINNNGKEIIREIDHKNKDIDTLTIEVLDEILAKKYISKEKEYILLSIENKNNKENPGEYELKKSIENHFKTSEIKPIILKQYINKSSQIKDKAKKYNISLSKMTFVENIISLKKDLKERDLVGLSIADLVKLVEKNNLKLDEIVIIEEKLKEDLIKDNIKLENHIKNEDVQTEEKEIIKKENKVKPSDDEKTNFKLKLKDYNKRDLDDDDDDEEDDYEDYEDEDEDENEDDD